MPYKDRNKRKEKHSEYYSKNKEKLNAKGKEWWEIHKVEQNRKRNERYHKTAKGKYQTCRGNSKVRGIEFSLTLEQFESFWQQPCHYCGDIVTTIGLDRVDSDKGYCIDNVVSCCERCNYMKLYYSQDSFFSQCFKILKHQGLI